MKGPLARSSLKTGAMLGIRVLTQAAVLLLLTHLLGPQTYGHFASASSLAVVLGILPNLGSGYVMMARAPQHATAINDVWRYAWPLTMLLGLLLLAAYLPLAHIMGGANPMAWPTLCCLGAAELLATPLTMLLSFVLQASQRVPLGQFVQWLPLGLRVLAALPCFLIIETARLPAYALLQMLASLVGLALGFAMTRRIVALHGVPRYPDAQELTQGASYAAMHLVAANPSELDKVLAVRLIGAHDAGIYAAATRVMGALVMPVIALMLAAQPRLFHHAHQPTQQGHRLIWIIAMLALGWGLLCWLLLSLCSSLLPWLFGPSFAAMALLMPWLAAAAAPLSMRLAAGTVLVALGRPLERLMFELTGIAALVAGTLLLAPLFGMRGLAFALLASESSMAMIGWCLVWQRTRQSESG
ncbi:MAG: polysaccharide biosynthesis C-terminal domain-containing protein [Rhodanobacter sp.]